DPERSPHDPARRRCPGEAHARLEAAVERLVERAAVAVLAGQDELPGGEVDVRLAVVLLHPGREVLPREPQVQREVVPDPEVVLGEDADAVPKVGEGSDEAAAPLGGHLVQQEVREAEAGERAVVLEVAEDALVARVGEALMLVQPASAELDRVTSPEERELLRDLVGLDVVELRAAGVTEAHVTADVERAEAGDGLPTGDTDGRVGVADARPIGGNGLELDVREA